LRTIGLLILSLPMAASGAADRPAAARQSRDVVAAYLIDRIGLAPSDVDAIDRGRPIARARDGLSAEDIGVVGAVRIHAEPAAFLRRLRDIVTFERSANVLQIGTFGTPPSARDLAGLTLDADDLAALPSCTPGDCDLQLSSDAMERFRTGVNWKSSGSTSAANAAMRQMLASLVTAYQATGNDGLGQYDDSQPPVKVAAEFRLLGMAREMPVPLAALGTYLTDYPQISLRSAEQFFYWSKVDFGLKRTIRANHVTIYPLSDRRDGLRYVVATKQLYSSHYFSTALELRFLIDDPARPGQGFVLLLVTKSRVPGLSSTLGAVIRRVVKGRATTSMEKHLQHVKKLVEGRQ
jgi:hypothetical protein